MWRVCVLREDEEREKDRDEGRLITSLIWTTIKSAETITLKAKYVAVLHSNVWQTILCQTREMIRMRWSPLDSEG